jgi:hypothetical protein
MYYDMVASRYVVTVLEEKECRQKREEYHCGRHMDLQGFWKILG